MHLRISRWGANNKFLANWNLQSFSMSFSAIFSHIHLADSVWFIRFNIFLLPGDLSASAACAQWNAMKMKPKKTRRLIDDQLMNAKTLSTPTKTVNLIRCDNLISKREEKYQREASTHQTEAISAWFFFIILEKWKETQLRHLDSN